MAVEETTEELALEGRSVVIEVTRFPKGTSRGRVTSLAVGIEPDVKNGGDPVDVSPALVVDALIYALKLNYDAESQHGSNETAEDYVEDVARILLSQIENDEPSSLMRVH